VSVLKEKKLPYGVASDSDHLPPLIVTREWLHEAHDEVFGGPDEFRAVPVSAFWDSSWADLFEQFYRERIAFVRNINVVLLRFAYDYEVDLDRIASPAALLNWVLHLCGKT
jgi:hypothetical protein